MSIMMALFGGGLIVSGVGGIISLICAIFWLWMLFHAITNPGLSGNERLLWVLVVFFLPCLGAILYFFLVKSKSS